MFWPLQLWMSCKLEEQKIQSVWREWLEEKDIVTVIVSDTAEENAVLGMEGNILDMPEDLSAKQRNVSVQTETCLQNKFEELCEGFSQQQIRSLMNVLVQFVMTEDNEIKMETPQHIDEIYHQVNFHLLNNFPFIYF